MKKGSVKTTEAKVGLSPHKLAFYSTGKLAARWGVSPQTIRRMMEDGTIKAVTVRKSRRISAAVVSAYEEKHFL